MALFALGGAWVGPSILRFAKTAVLRVPTIRSLERTAKMATNPVGFAGPPGSPGPSFPSKGEGNAHALQALREDRRAMLAIRKEGWRDRSEPVSGMRRFPGDEDLAEVGREAGRGFDGEARREGLPGVGGGDRPAVDREGEHVGTPPGAKADDVPRLGPVPIGERGRGGAEAEAGHAATGEQGGGPPDFQR
jgi:hypothetical protein